MRTTLKWARASMAAVLFVATCVGDVAAADMNGKPGGQVGSDSVLRIPGNAAFPLSKRIDLGVGRSIVVQFPIPLKDVLVSDPSMLDAVVQSSDRVFLIAKKTGQTNAFFFDEYGQQILTLEVAVGADLSALDHVADPPHSGLERSQRDRRPRHRAHRHRAHAHRFQPRRADRRAVRASERRFRQHRHGAEPPSNTTQHDHHQYRPRDLELSVEQRLQRRLRFGEPATTSMRPSP